MTHLFLPFFNMFIFITVLIGALVGLENLAAEELEAEKFLEALETSDSDPRVRLE